LHSGTARSGRRRQASLVGLVSVLASDKNVGPRIVTRPPLLEQIQEHGFLADLDPAARRLALRSFITESDAVLSAEIKRVADWIDGYGPLTDLMGDDAVTDILVNGPEEVWAERAGSLVRTEVSFGDHATLLTFVDRLFGEAGIRLDTLSPIADARLPDGSRIHAVLEPIAQRSCLISIRKFPRMWTLAELQLQQMFDDHDRRRLENLVRSRKSIVVAGATGSGKTTLVNALLALVGKDERVVLIEETPELSPAHPHCVSLVTRRANLEGRGAIEASQLLRAALRMRPDRIIIGEVRGPEASVALSALRTGHPGSMLTVHAAGSDSALDRLAELAVSGTGQSQDALLDEWRRALDVIVHVERVQGLRRIASICEL
jgi:pilus assembly protein CpaF